MGIKKEMLIGAIKDMKDAERRAEVLEKMVEVQNEIDESWKVRDELSEKERFDMIDKYGLMHWLEDEKITNIKVKESIIKTFEMIKQLEETAKDELYSYVWDSIYGCIAIESSIDDMLISQQIYIRGDELSLNNLDDKYDSVESAFEKIRINLHDAHREREERLKNPSASTFDRIFI
ncbi:hypothetical protein [Bacillus mycoides]|uniref:hypothetical protein n=1 Tax=Bacillus mycoides TaxID=1405 RepID=UPI00032D7DED|nr:hypothetical protein [Bacillus mycoides]EOO35082.1 hypothetical protein IKK_05153 [Bacillus mycoides]